MNDKVKQYLQYAGFVSAVMGAIGYVLIIYALVMGFENALELAQILFVAILGAVVGILINIALRYQGITFAKQTKEAIDINKRYQEIKNRDKPEKEYKLIGWFMFWAIVKDFFFKGVTIGLTTYYTMYTFIDGNGDYSLFIVALANLLMFAGLGAMGMAGMYDKYIDEHIPALTGLCNKLDQVGSVRLEEK